MKPLVILTVLCLSLFSCSNDDDSILSEQDNGGFFALKIGNEWNYEYFQRQGDTENFFSTSVTVNQKVTAKDIINGENIYTLTLTTSGNPNDLGVYPDNGETVLQVKDSLGYLVQFNGNILFSSIIEEDYLIASQNFGDIYGKLQDQNENIEVAGEPLISKVNERFIILESGDIASGREKTYYSPENGQTLETISFVNSQRHLYEKRLINFNIVD